MSFRNKLFYAIDLIIAVSFVLSAATGVILWLGGSDGLQGEQSAGSAEILLGLTRGTWKDLHNWVSVVLLAGIAIHIILHTSWIIGIAKQTFRAGRSRSAGAVKARRNLALDTVIGVAFVLSVFTGVIRWAAGSGGFQGGRNPSFQWAILGLTRSTWSDLHTWVSMVMITGVLIHLVLHWSWIVQTTKRLLGAGSTRASRSAGLSDRRTGELRTCPVETEKR